MLSKGTKRALVLLAAAGGAVALVVSLSGSAAAAVLAGLVTLVVALLITRDRLGNADVPSPDRRRFLGLAAAGGLTLVVGGSIAGREIRRLTRPDPVPTLDEMAANLGAEYMELVRRAYHPGRSGDIQLVVAPYNSANYPQESVDLVPRDPRTSHASVWMYLERIPLVVWSPGAVEPTDSAERVTLADLAPTTAAFMGFDGFRAPDGRVLPGAIAPTTVPPKVIVTFVIDGGGWNVLEEWPDAWPNLKRLMREGTNYRNAITGSFPAVTAAAHATIGTGAFPRTHGITGHNIRDGGNVRKAYGEAGRADPGDILIPTLADRWSDDTGNRAWVGEIGYQVWHLGMLGYGGRNRGPDQQPVASYWAEDGAQEWASQNPDLFRLPNEVPGLEVLEQYQAAYVPPGYDSQFDPVGKKAVCCSPPVIRYQGDLIEAAFDSEPIGRGDQTSLLYINYKAPDYAGHIYNMLSKMEEEALAAVDAQLGRLAAMLEQRFEPGGYVLIVTADHGQCPLPDAAGGTRVDPIQLDEDIEAEFGTGIFPVVQEVVPSEIYLDGKGLADTGVRAEDIAAWLADYRYGQNIGPYVPRSAVEADLLNQRSFAAVFPTSYLEAIRSRDPATWGETAFAEADPGVSPPLLIAPGGTA